MADKELSSTTKLLYGFLNSFSNLWGHTTVDNGTLMSCLSTSERTIQRGIVQLEQKGYIKVTTSNGRRTISPLLTFKEPKKKKKQEEEKHWWDDYEVPWEEA